MAAIPNLKHFLPFYGKVLESRKHRADRDQTSFLLVCILTCLQNKCIPKIKTLWLAFKASLNIKKNEIYYECNEHFSGVHLKRLLDSY